MLECVGIVWEKAPGNVDRAAIYDNALANFDVKWEDNDLRYNNVNI